MYMLPFAYFTFFFVRERDIMMRKKKMRNAMSHQYPCIKMNLKAKTTSSEHTSMMTRIRIRVT